MMADLSLELIAYRNPTYGEPQTLALPVANHVHKRIERFVYLNDVKEDAIPIAYLENTDLDSRANIQIADKTWTIPANSKKLVKLRSPLTVITSLSYTSEYKSIAATNKTFVDEEGRVRPLFWRHDLPPNTTECELKIVTRGNRHIVDTGYILDLDAGAIYTNYRNFFDADTGAYRLFMVVCTDVDGNTSHTLLNPLPVAKEATWEDIDQETGLLTDAYPVYSTTKTASGYSFYFSFSDTWYIKPLEKSLLHLRPPAGRDPDDFWFVRVTDGDFSGNVNNAVRRYYVPEFDKQPFSPYKPVAFSPYQKLLRVNRRVLAATRENLAVDPEGGLHLTIFISDVEGVLIKVLTTDVSLEGVRYSDTDVFYETDKILSWDNEDGFVALGLNLQRSWQFDATYYYKADDYEYTLVNLNPLTDPTVLDYTFVFYAVPGADTEDRAIHHLKVDQNGIIVETSQDLGLTHSNLKLRNPDNTFNPGTVIGMKYISDVETDTFIKLYTAGEDNNNAYAVLGEVTVFENALVEDQFDIDVRRPGAVIRPEKFEEAIRANPRILQSYLGYGEDGMEVAENGVMVIKIPIYILEDYGGDLSQDEAERLLRTHMPSAGYAVIDWEWQRTVISLDSDEVPGQVSLKWWWENSDWDYRLYRKRAPADEWELIHTMYQPVSEPPDQILRYTDTDVNSGEVWYYSVRMYGPTSGPYWPELPESELYELPAANSIGVKVR